LGLSDGAKIEVTSAGRWGTRRELKSELDRRPEGPARQIVAAARELLEAEGAEGLSMRRIAERLGVRAPSLYEHIPSKQALEAALISEGLSQWAEFAGGSLAETGDGEQLTAVAHAYRGYAKDHPHLYRLMKVRPLPRDDLAPDVERRAAQPVVDAVAGDGDLARALWSFLHGMVINELNNRFPPGANLDAAWERGLSAFRRGTCRCRPRSADEIHFVSGRRQRPHSRRCAGSA
jgi:AcrR family transcriptional regulator